MRLIVLTGLMMTSGLSLAAQVNHNPDSARIITTDIPHFWQAFDARQRLGTAVALDSFYLRPASPGLRDWIQLRIKDAATLAKTVDAGANYYASARASTLTIAAAEPRIRAAFAKLKDLYPDAVFPDVYFVIGRLSSGGTWGPSGLLIGAEMYGRTTDEAMAGLSDWLHQVLSTVDKVPTIVSHELVHAQQAIPGNSLLAESLREGGADFVAELMTHDNLDANVHAWVFSEPGREKALWEEFRGAMHGRDLRGWFSSDDVKKRPNALGYFIGYQIAKAYCDKASDKGTALREILRTKDPDALLRASGYGERFEK